MMMDGFSNYRLAEKEKGNLCASTHLSDSREHKEPENQFDKCEKHDDE